MTTYQGSCQCGAVAFTAQMELASAITCNCSRCHKLGSVLSFVPRAQVTVTSGEGALTEYRFGSKKISHQFCSICGIQPFGFGTGSDGVETAAINIRCLRDVDLAAVPTQAVDGKSF